jgi:hypothetical protein
MNGDIIGAKNLGSDLVDDELLSKEQREEHPIDQQAPTSWQFERNVWTSLQFTEAKAVLNTMMSEMNTKKCKNCGAKVPKITCPIFGRLYQVPILVMCIFSLYSFTLQCNNSNNLENFLT